MLKATNITKTFPNGAGGTLTALNDVSISIKPGKLTALIGASGSGKTTLLKCMSLLDFPDTGRIIMDDTPYVFPRTGTPDAPITPKPWPKMTAVFQQLFLWPHLTLRENILLPIPKGKDVSTRLKELIDMFSMHQFIDRYPNETSGGQKQRAAIARALILDPQYLLLDEITSALDIEQTTKVLECLATLKKLNIGALLITHHINFAKKAADHIAFMDEGKIIEEGTPSLLTKPKHPRTKQFLQAVKAAS